jgi:hypothetical protein
VPVTAFHVRVAEDVVDGGGEVVEGERINVTGTTLLPQVPALIVTFAL